MDPHQNIMSPQHCAKELFFLPKAETFLFYASIKVFQATAEAFRTPKTTSSSLKNEISHFFSLFVGHFCLPGSGIGSLPVHIL
jgi:hypothetical protein